MGGGNKTPQTRQFCPKPETLKMVQKGLFSPHFCFFRGGWGGQRIFFQFKFGPNLAFFGNPPKSPFLTSKNPPIHPPPPPQVKIGGFWGFLIILGLFLAIFSKKYPPPPFPPMFLFSSPESGGKKPFLRFSGGEGQVVRGGYLSPGWGRGKVRRDAGGGGGLGPPPCSPSGTMKIQFNPPGTGGGVAPPP